MIGKVKIIPLGGVEEIGINSTAIEYEDKIVVVDMGLGFPIGEQYGIDYVIPNVDYLKKNKKRIEGIIITHGHLDHIGALPFVLKDLDFPEIYATKFAIAIIKSNFARQGFEKRVKIHEIRETSKLLSGKMEINFFNVNHSIPESMGVIIKTPTGNIIHTGDFKFDNSPINESVADYAKIAQYGSEGVLALISDSTNSFKVGHSKSESEIREALKDIIEKVKGRVIIATFSSLVNRITELIKIAVETERKVAITGRSMERIVELAKRVGYIKVPENTFIKTSQLQSFPSDKVMVLSTGAQGEPLAALARMAKGDHKDIKIKKGDVVILSASIIPGNDMLVQGLIDELSEKGAQVYHNAEYMDLHTSGHAYQEDQKLMLNLVKPKYFIPVHGYPSFLHRHAQTAVEVGIKEQNIIISKRGDIIFLDNKKWEINGKVKSTPVFVSGKGVGDVGTIVLSDRQQLANYGVLALAFSIDYEKKEVKDEVHIQSRGFVYVKDNKALMNKTKEMAKDFIDQELKKSQPLTEIKEELISKLKSFFYKETQREPVILILTVQS